MFILHPSAFILPKSFILLKISDFVFKKSLGQNFLVDKNIAARGVRELGPRALETVLEIGPGRGALTAPLIESGAQVIALEFDRELVPNLTAQFGMHDNFRVIQCDALKTDYCSLLAPSENARLIANLPYNIATALLQRLIEQRNCITEMVVMLQREVVARITAQPSTPDRGYLSVIVQAYCEAEALFDVSPEAFRPTPKVWSTVVRLTGKPPAEIEITDHLLFSKILSASLAQRRKTISNNLRSAPHELLQVIERTGGVLTLLRSASIDAARRAETLTNKEWADLTQLISRA
ncbi:MAG: 16S rRNA (adenine(1518)-N(6)/adenine(1519)-N(6))-dimethyltransferase RsmA [Pyrinomonadaceae bacterium]